jgi:hypothetical protein
VWRSSFRRRDGRERVRSLADGVRGRTPDFRLNRNQVKLSADDEALL